MPTRVGDPINVPAAGTITWPAGANAFTLAGNYYDGANQGITALGGSRITVGQLLADPSAADMGAYAAWGRINSSGSDTISRTKAGSYSEGPTCQVQCYNVADPTNFVREGKVIGWPNSSGPATLSVLSQTTDLVDGMVMGDGGSTVTATITGFTAAGTEQVVNADKSRTYRADSPGASSTSMTGPNNSWGSLALFSIFDAGGGGTAHDLAGTAAAQASATAALVLAKSLMASAAAQAAGGAALSKTVPLAGGAAAQASGSAVLLKGVSLAAAGLANASASAAISHQVPLAANAAAVASAGAQLALAVTLEADAIAQALGTAALSTGASNDLAANAQAQVSGTAVLSLAVSLSGAAVAQAQASAALALGKSLAASGAAVASASGTLSVTGDNELAANALAQASAGATLALDVALSASAIAQAQAGGLLTVTLVLGANALAQSSASAQLLREATLLAHGIATASAMAVLQVISDTTFTANSRTRVGPALLHSHLARIGGTRMRAQPVRIGRIRP